MFRRIILNVPPARPKKFIFILIFINVPEEHLIGNIAMQKTSCVPAERFVLINKKFSLTQTFLCNDFEERVFTINVQLE